VKLAWQTWWLGSVGCGDHYRRALNEQLSSSLGITRPLREDSQKQGKRSELRAIAFMYEWDENKEDKNSNMANSRGEEGAESFCTNHG